MRWLDFLYILTFSLRSLSSLGAVRHIFEFNRNPKNVPSHVAVAAWLDLAFVPFYLWLARGLYRKARRVYIPTLVTAIATVIMSFFGLVQMVQNDANPILLQLRTLFLIVHFVMAVDIGYRRFGNDNVDYDLTTKKAY